MVMMVMIFLASFLKKILSWTLQTFLYYIEYNKAHQCITHLASLALHTPSCDNIFTAGRELYAVFFRNSPILQLT